MSSILVRQKPKIVGILNPGVDVFRHSLREPGNDAGTKSKWNDQDDAVFYGAITKYCRGQETKEKVCIGGGSVAILGAIARAKVDGKTAYSVHAHSAIGGSGDAVSDAFYQQAQRLPFRTHIQRRLGHVVGGCVIDLLPNGDSASRGSDRDPIDAYFDGSIGEGANVVVASGKLSTLRLLHKMPEGAKLTYTPSSSDCANEPQKVREHLSARELFLLTLNNKEASGFMGGDTIAKMASRATRYAENVLITAGGDGMYLAQRGGEVTFCRAAPAVGEVVDTTGAGECAHGVVVHGLLQGWLPEDILDSATRACAETVQHIGALGPWQPSL